MKKLPSLRLMTGTAIVFGVMSAVAGLSSALFSDAVKISDSTFATGTADLEIATEATPLDYGPAIAGDNTSGIMPGDNKTFVFWLHNNSDDTMPLELSTLLTDIGTTGGDAIRTDLSIGFVCDIANDGLTTPDTSIAPKTLQQWNLDGETLGLGELAPGTADNAGLDEAKCTMTTSLDAGSNATGSSATFDAQFTGTQVVATPTPTPIPTIIPES